ncbi:Rho guanine nucleotide exchange factor scd1 OS=Schizosaccharomyces pombe (strain 972 / ATCC 24843) GN=scd1 PE=1 SV=2 [Rhizoctonia solani AG-1 IB]|uniref:Rho guanine nucleotide exchange factor scd1 n=1 Tax=Thanatephorus cucumeris (strain AG1-IB / isolate 7/3/14) TaxID=1108050 RepID=A0A0B7FB29_THACB|nr:Rho guanine nucleotide exchange factor scd1 OS=Schizosaccharomyces pombe (strain 972 / ATCC 24843) GN=scd1 PE=1 SV=2 [Rhizoctonia solani AG-1 IB]
MTTMAPRKKSLLGASNPLVQDPGFLPALSSNLAALGPMATSGAPASPVPTLPPPIAPVSMSMSMSMPTPTPSAPLTNTMSLVNKTGTQSLYQRCSYALGRLLRIDGIASFFTLSNSGRAPPRSGLPQDEEGQKGPRDSTMRARQSTDPVRQLWDLLALGVPLCVLYNALPGVDPLQIDCSIEETERKLAKAASAGTGIPSNKHAKHATAFFIMGLKQLAESGDLRGQPEMFTVSELFGNNTNGFVKVVSTVIFLLERLPESIFSPAPPSPPSLVSHSHKRLSFPPTVPSACTDDESFRKKHIQETLDAERKYVADLEVMHEYARELIQKNVVDADTVHHLFPGLGKLLDFGRRFLIEMEGIAQCAWEDQRWGLLFIDNEDEFAVYEPYCANYTNASELMLSQEQNLMNLAHVVNPKTELPMFLIKPVQKICKYHLQLLDLIKRASREKYPHYDELEQGYQVAKRIADQANETLRKVDNRNTVKALEARVDDWKGHQLHNFGELLLEDIFIVTKADVDREYHVFLFEKIILCCKEVAPMDPRKAGTIGKVGKSGSLLKKQQSLGPGGMASPALAGGSKKKTPLLLKGRIFLNNVTKTVAGKPSHALQVWWRGDDDLEFFTLRCRSEEQLGKWETAINQLIKENANRRANDRARQQHDRALSTSSALSYAANPPPYSSNQHLPPYPGPRTPRVQGHSSVPTEDDGDYPASGRATPLEARRSQPPERERERAEYERPRARTEGADGATMMQYRQHPPPMPPPTGGLPSIPRGAPLPPRGGSEASFGPGREPSFGTSRPVQNLRSKFSSTRLRSAYDSQNASTESMPKVHEGGYHGDEHDGHVSRESATTPTPRNGSAPPHLRMRSASQPSAYAPPPPQQPPPPVPRWNGNGSASSLGTSPEEKRESGSSQSTNLSSEYSPTNTQSPITPFGDGSGAGRRLLGSGESVRVKVHYKTDLFQIIVPRDTIFNDLVSKVAHKVRLCGEAGERDAPLRVKYRDEDGDMISLGSDDDVQMAFDGTRTSSGGVELWVS